MNAQDIVNAAYIQVAFENLSSEQKLVDKTIEQFDFKKAFIIEKKAKVLLLVMIKTDENQTAIETLMEEKLVSLGYSFEKVGVGGFMVNNPAKEILGIN
jgi:hypothetical protein